MENLNSGDLNIEVTVSPEASTAARGMARATSGTHPRS